MTITAAYVKRLRDATGAGMLASKNALVEADGDFEKAIEVLRVKGGKKVEQRGLERTASAGLVVNSGGALVELNSETDFVAKSEGFIALAGEIALEAEKNATADADALLQVTLPSGRTVARRSWTSPPSSARSSSSGASPTSTARWRHTCTVAPATSRMPSA